LDQTDRENHLVPRSSSNHSDDDSEDEETNDYVDDCGDYDDEDCHENVSYEPAMG